MTDAYVPRPIIDEDTIDLSALRFVLREAEIRYRSEIELSGHEDGERHQRESDGRRAATAIGDIATRDCMRFEGETTSPNRPRAVERVYSMYALHPETAEQVIAALEALMKAVGPRYRILTRPREHTAKTVRNTRSDKEREAQ